MRDYVPNMGHAMRLAAIAVLLLGLAESAVAAPLTLLCSGSLMLDSNQTTIERQTAILDLERRSFKPPLYPEFQVTRVSESDLTFGSELPDLSTWGSLDRISGSLTMSVMRPNERKKLQAGGSAKFLAWMDAKCVPAQRMF